MKLPKKIPLIKLTFISLMIFLLFTNLKQHDEKLRLIHADVSKSTIIADEVVRILSGNVYLVQDSLSFWCDSAYYFKNLEKTSFYGNVKIIRGKEHILAQQIDYFREKKKAFARGKVLVRQPNKWLRCEYLTHYFKQKITFARKNVKLYDKENKIKAWAQELDYFALQKKTILRNKSIVHKLEEKKSNMLKIYSDTLIYFSADSNKKMISYGKVKFIQKDIKAICDSASYLIDKEIISLNYSPIVYQSNNEMKGEKINIYLKERKPQKITIWKNSELHSIIDSTKMEEDLLKGNEIFITFEQDSVRMVKARKNAIGRYHVVEDGEKGLNYVSADSLILFIKKNKVDSIYVAGGAEGTYYPENKMENAP